MPVTAGRDNQSNPTNSLRADLAEIRRSLAILCEPREADSVYELRALGTEQGIISGYYDSHNLNQLAVDAAALCDRFRPSGIFITPNPVDGRLLARAANRCIGYAKHSTTDRDIVHRRWFLVDFDPVRPAGISSTDAEHESALAKAREARELLCQMGWRRESMILADSGNGGHLLCPVDLPNNDTSRDLLKHCLEALAHKLDDDLVKVDRTTFNAARIWKLYGTVVRKGDNLPGNPHRIARVLS